LSTQEYDKVKKGYIKWGLNFQKDYKNLKLEEKLIRMSNERVPEVTINIPFDEGE